jgi:primosomal protein N' (replication factor Y)
LADAQSCLQVAVPAPLPQLFDYLPPESGPVPGPGSRVVVPFGRRALVALVVGRGQATADRALKGVEAVLDYELLDPELIDLAGWCSRYYCFPPGELVSLLLPTALRRRKPFRPPSPEGWALTATGREADLDRSPRKRELRDLLRAGASARDRLSDLGFSPALIRDMHQSGWIEPAAVDAAPMPEAGPVLNSEQRLAVARLLRARGRYEAFLLAGVTGSGKTEVYLRSAAALLRRGRQVLVLVPEIGLTPQLVRRFEARLGLRAWTYHSSLSEGERLSCWQAARSGRARLVIGTRSSVFLPMPELALIVVDEEHDSAFKQQDGARYQGRDVAVLRARQAAIPIVLGSATPALESLANVRAGRYRLLELSQRAGVAVEPSWHVLDQRGCDGPLHPALVAQIERHLGQGGQVLLYRNRRGYAPVLMCNACGWSADCHRCSAHMTWHQAQARLQCHHCGASQAQPRRCPDCGDPNLKPLGAGTERLEALLKERFTGTPVHRVDRDQLSGKHDFEQLIEGVRGGGPCILVGTQMLAKGHHLPGVTLAAVLDTDAALFSADFRAPERLGQAVHQVAGRAGRADRPGAFYLQTHHPEHALIAALLNKDYLGFADQLLAERQQTDLPPASGLALVRAEAHDGQQARSFLKDAAAVIRAPGIDLAGPVPAILSRRSGYWRFQLWVQAADRRHLAERLGACLDSLYGLPSARRVRWHVDMDAVDL